MPAASVWRADLAEAGQHVFLDAKLLDIPNTVERATANAARLGAAFLTVHGTDRKTLDAAMRGRGSTATKLLAITVLTSLDEADLSASSISGSRPASWPSGGRGSPRMPGLMASSHRPGKRPRSAPNLGTVCSS